jgi:hypothetical protein
LPRNAARWATQQRVLVQSGRAAGQQIDAEPRRRQQARDVAVVLRRQDFGRRHERGLQAVLHRDDGREERDDRLPGADVALQQPVHRLRLPHVVDDLLQRQLLPRRQLERQHRCSRGANAIVDLGNERLQLDAAGMTAPRMPELIEEELFEDEAALRIGAERVEDVDRRFVRREMRLLERAAPRRQQQSCPHRGRQHVGDLRRELIERQAHESALHVRRDSTGLLVERDDAPRVDAGGTTLLGRVAVGVAGHELVLRVHEMQSGGVELDVAEDDDLQVRLEDVGEERLVHPGAADRAAGVGEHRMEDPESAAARDGDVGAPDLAEHRGLLTRSQ